MLDMSLVEAAELLAQSPDFRVLRKFTPRAKYADEPWNLGDRSRARVGLYVDVESTGLDTEEDEIIELGIVPFSYDAERGVVYDVLPSFSAFEQPRVKAISPEISALTGITNAMVEGQRIDDAAVQALIDRSAICFAHNADFDRRMLERRFAGFVKLPWACTQREINWKAFGVNGGALGNILMSACGEFAENAHRAIVDCHVGVHILASAQLDERTALSMVLESARQTTYRVCAIRAPMRAKDQLRSHGYRALYSNGFFAYWYKDLRADVADEVEWCKNVAGADPLVRQISAHDRYSTRADR